MPERSPWEVTNQYFAIASDSLVLVRLENRDGEWASNTYTYPNITFGPDFPLLTEDDVLQELASDDEVKVLRCLMWLGGKHENLSQRPAQLHLESLDHARFYRRICENPRLKPLLTTLASSRDPWIAEGAQEALKAIGTKQAE